MKQAYTINPSFSAFFHTANLARPSKVRHETTGAASWTLRNVMAYSAALFVVKTRDSGNHFLLMN